MSLRVNITHKRKGNSHIQILYLTNIFIKVEVCGPMNNAGHFQCFPSYCSDLMILFVQPWQNIKTRSYETQTPPSTYSYYYVL